MQVVALNRREARSLARNHLARARPRLAARLVHTRRELRDAQRLRARVFSEEYGIGFDDPDGLDQDRYDAFCQHLSVYDESSGGVVATTRLLTQEGSRLAGGFYSATEFDLTPLGRLPGRILEVGRTCVHPDYRSGAAIAVLWSGLAEYLRDRGFSYLIGCASIGLSDGGYQFSRIMPELRANHLVDSHLRVSPRRQLMVTDVSGEGGSGLPPLLKAYLRMGCKIGGEACWDPDFNCADVLVVLDVNAMSTRYAQRFLKAG